MLVILMEYFKNRKPKEKPISTNKELGSMYLEDTEVLTKDGFKKMLDLKEGDHLLTRYSDSNITEWEKVDTLIEEDYEGEIYWLETRYIKSPKFVPDTFLWARPMKHGIADSNEYYYREEGNVIDALAEQCELLKYTNCYRKPLIFTHSIDLSHKENITSLNIGDYSYNPLDFFFWLGLVATDGSVSKSDPVISITQCKTQNIEIISDSMDKLFSNRWKKYEYDRSKRGLSRIWHFNIYDHELHKYIEELIGRTKIERRLNKLFDYSHDLLESFLDGALLGDGWNNESSNNIGIFCGISEDLTKDYQVLLAFFGRRSNVLSKDERGKKSLVLSSGNYIETKNILWRISIHRESASSVKRHHHQKEEFKGKVYCPDTINELFYVRREGMSLWMSTK